MIDDIIKEFEEVNRLIMNSSCSQETKEEFFNIVNDYIEKSKTFETDCKEIKIKLKHTDFQLLSILKSIKPLFDSSIINQEELIQSELKNLKRLYRQFLIIIGITE